MTKRAGIAFALLGAVALSAGPAVAQGNPDDLRFTAHFDPGIDRVQQLLVQHYDPAYRRSSMKNYPQLIEAPAVRIASTDSSAFDAAAKLAIQAGEHADVLHGTAAKRA